LRYSKRRIKYDYWLPEYTLHNYKTRAHKIEVKGKGNTPPKISWAHISGDNIIQAKFTMVQKFIM